VRKQGVILEDCIDIPFIGWQARDVLSVQVNLSRGGAVETGDHAQAGRLPGAGGTKHGKKFAIQNFEISFVYCLDLTKMAADVIEAHCRNGGIGHVENISFQDDIGRACPRPMS
jgi:hypothetical protein